MALLSSLAIVIASLPLEIELAFLSDRRDMIWRL